MRHANSSTVVLIFLMLLLLLLFRAFLIGYRIDLIRVEAAEIFQYRCFPAIFSFGDDWADTGNAQALYPAHLEAENLPYGMTYFGKPAHRLSDGRLLIDFFAQAFGMPFLNSYAVGIVPSLRHGVNFAVAGTTASSLTLQVPYPLSLQVDWLYKFRLDVMAALNQPEVTQPLPENDNFQNGLYIVSSGLNDYRHAFVSQNLSVAQAVELVPSIVSRINATIQVILKAGGAKYIMVMNLPPLGCSPEFLTLFASLDTNDYDAAGCLKLYNTVAQLHNQLLNNSLQVIRSSLNATSELGRKVIAYVDYYQLMFDVIENPQAHGKSIHLHSK
ncbi:hypothetical protein O6H91_14G047900 [Diphasiastrum complanatum]|uniref:Uncharacterized protein n=1 Tax=Diphasiastrum complanatum TaxID=34168 RepID=A0ACC2BPU4_DIPCM|nr:hypothetical protein O6H91_14G047900 [Diphasiastrum complanatum]